MYAAAITAISDTKESTGSITRVSNGPSAWLSARCDISIFSARDSRTFLRGVRVLSRNACSTCPRSFLPYDHRRAKAKAAPVNKPKQCVSKPKYTRVGLPQPPPKRIPIKNALMHAAAEERIKPVFPTALIHAAYLLYPYSDLANWDRSLLLPPCAFAPLCFLRPSAPRASENMPCVPIGAKRCAMPTASAINKGIIR